MDYKIAVVGATGSVGRAIVEVLSERAFPISKIFALASSHSTSTQLSFGKLNINVMSLSNFDFSDVDIAFFASNEIISQKYIDLAVQSRCIVIDNSSLFRLDKDIPLIIPEVNAKAISMYNKCNIIANPNCIVIQLLTVLKPIYDVFLIKRVVMSTYQSVSGAGKEAIDELYSQTKSKLVSSSLTLNVFSKVIAFNVLPQIGNMLDNGSSEEEQKIQLESTKIMNANLNISATCVRVPVFIGHSISVNIEFECEINIDQIILILKNSPMIKLVEDDYITPIEIVGTHMVFVNRLRIDTSAPNAINMWIVADNLRKGAALNAVQIAEELIKYL